MIAARGLTPLQQVIEVIGDLGTENIRLIREVRLVRRAILVVALAFVAAAFMMRSAVLEQEKLRQSLAAQAEADRAQRARDGVLIRKAVNRAEAAAIAAERQAQEAVLEGITAQVEAQQVRAAILPPSKRQPVEAEIREKRAKAASIRDGL